MNIFDVVDVGFFFVDVLGDFEVVVLTSEWS